MLLSDTVNLVIENGVGVIWVNNPPVNALSHSVRAGILAGLEQANTNSDISAIVIGCDGNTFIAGADIKEFGEAPKEPHLPDVLHAIRNSAKPVTAALHGTVLGGGFELALSCHYRVAITGTKVGLPEVKLGLIPGASGTQLLPRYVGVETALSMITSGKMVSTASLPDLIDMQVDDDRAGQNNSPFPEHEHLVNHASIIFAKRTANDAFVPPDKRDISGSFDEDTFDSWRKKLAKKAKGQLAPQSAIDAIEAATQLPFNEALALERTLFVACRDSEQSRAMRYAFFAEKHAASGYAKSTCDVHIRSVAVIGAGTMGTGIAIAFANSGYSVTLVENSEEMCVSGLERIRHQYQKMHDQGRMSEAQKDQALSLISGTSDYGNLADIDLVVEAAFEKMSVKKMIFSSLDAVCKPSAIFATNTSYLDIDEIATSTTRPEQVIGMHFFSPANVMKLVEVVKARSTSEQAVSAVMQTAKRMGKVPVCVGVGFGFVGNRMYAAYGREANMLLLEGASPEQIDSAMESWGMAMGPLAVNDMSGIDIAYKARREYPPIYDDPAYFLAADTMVEHGRLGRKTGVGFYRYENGKKTNDPTAMALIAIEAERLGIEARKVSDEQIQNRLVLALVNEGANLLEKGIARNSEDIDTIWLNGYGFPRFRGGPMYYAKASGINNTIEGIKYLYRETNKNWWLPSEKLETI
ncbi:3-hydroxyacyl-CoA dehydrogenase NAD-binding domain-containing protein [Enterovibrio sp. ZSDZ35]|uniref:3-hydroxyacyl-CoA dehydrogenase NAD-binding domain-containing protein n=1 Tax=Enterovibrio qingdaonensis TaxID=2899818 RepID=A0ABT5QHE7_9GAMM|nr:3-hydroxyacyl-CoA dehydrogenase NAD-binding domain-containing protein [Enterovibrio sp. ZSDZ35]MDD1780407.1 3-hydroxyacyl-CoA dehydrogenase NAD-binding domain-containing protein [Enterovibrio sp. ZSDZ35]